MNEKARLTETDRIARTVGPDSAWIIANTETPAETMDRLTNKIEMLEQMLTIAVEYKDADEIHRLDAAHEAAWDDHATAEMLCAERHANETTRFETAQ